jgi:hypothetical protein
MDAVNDAVRSVNSDTAHFPERNASECEKKKEEKKKKQFYGRQSREEKRFL